jgi:hypothetical protein
MTIGFSEAGAAVAFVVGSGNVLWKLLELDISKLH